MAKKDEFEKNQVMNMVAVGEVGPTYARIWMRSEKPGSTTKPLLPLKQKNTSPGSLFAKSKKASK